MGRYIRWQAIIAIFGVILLGAYLSSITIIQTTVTVLDDEAIYREGVVGQPRYLNPLLAEYNPIDQDIAALLFEGLTRPTGQGNYTAVLADDWIVQDEGRAYIFNLRDDVLWSDGTPFTAQDVLFTLTLIQDPDFPGNPSWQQFWASIGVEVLGPHTVRFTLPEVLPNFLEYTSVGLLPAHRLEGLQARRLLTHPFNLAPVGTGPLRLVEATNQRVLLRPNPRYRTESGSIQQVEFRFYPNQATVYDAFRRGEVDGVSYVSPLAASLYREQPDVQLYSAVLPRYEALYFNLRQAETWPFFQEATIRQALALAVDRETLVETVLRGQGIAHPSPLWPWGWAYNPTQSYPTYNPAQATELLAAAGWVDTDGDGVRDLNGQAFRFSILVGPDRLKIQLAEQIAAQWQALGLDVSVEAGAENIATRLRAGDYAVALAQVQLPSDPDVYAFWHQTQIENGQNVSGWNNNAASLALEAGRQTLTRNERIKAYYTFQQEFAQDVPAIVLYYPIYLQAMHTSVNNVQLPILTAPKDRFQTLPNWFIFTEQVIEAPINEDIGP
jgi:peptide/nickel transport system substrate-binding protein